MKKIYDKIIFSIVLLSILILVPIISLFDFSIENNKRFINDVERRNAVELTEIMNSVDKTKSFEDFYQDRMPFRRLFITTLSNLYYKANVMLFDQNVILGKNEFLFYAPWRIHHTGDKEHDISDIWKSLSNIDMIQKYIKDYDISFIYNSIPDKESVYSEFLPVWFMFSSNSSSAQYLNDISEKNDDFNYVVNVLDPLLQSKSKYNDLLYFKSDSHWSEVGSYVAYKKQIETLNSVYNLGLQRFELDDYQVDYYDNPSHDLKKFSGITVPIIDTNVILNQLDYEVNNIDNYININDIDLEHWKKDGIFLNKHALNDKTLLHIGDSFTTGVLPYYIATFSKVHTVHVEMVDLNNDSANEIGKLISMDNPDVIIFESAESFAIERLKQINISNITNNYLSNENLKYTVEFKDIEKGLNIISAYNHDDSIKIKTKNNPQIQISFEGKKNTHYILNGFVESENITHTRVFYGRENKFIDEHSEKQIIGNNNNSVNIHFFPEENFDTLLIEIGHLNGEYSIKDLRIYEIQ